MRFALVAAGLLATASLVALVPSAAAASQRCLDRAPDAYGYRCVPIDIDFIDISGDDHQLAMTPCDDCVSDPLPIGFDFSFYGTVYNQTYMSTNGFLAFLADAGDGCCSGERMPNGVDVDEGNPSAMIAAHWTDLDNDVVEGDRFLYMTQGEAPDRVFIAQWDDVPGYDDEWPGPTSLAQVRLYETTNHIEVHQVRAYATVLDLDEAAVGIESPSGNVGLTAAAGPYVHHDQAWRFVAPAHHQQPDLVVTMDMDDEAFEWAEPGAVVVNRGAVNATGVVLRLELPPAFVADLDTLDSEGLDGSCELSLRLLACDVGELGIDESATVSLAGEVPARAMALSFGAQASADQADLNRRDDRDTFRIRTLPALPDLRVSSEDPSLYDQDEGRTLNLAVHNAGPVLATAVAVEVRFPTGTVIDTVPAECVQAALRLTCDLDDLLASEVAYLFPDYHFSGTMRGAITATVRADNGEAMPSDNFMRLPVRAVPDVADIVLDYEWWAEPLLEAGENGTANIAVVNNGDEDLDVVLVGRLPAGVSVDPASLAVRESDIGEFDALDCTIRNRLVRCDITQLAHDETIILSFNVTARAAGFVHLVFTARTAALDVEPEDNRLDIPLAVLPADLCLAC